MTSRQAYLDSHPSVNASMDDFEAREFSPTFPEVPSHHSGFRSPHMSEYSEASRRSYSPPAWRKSGSGWFKQPSLSPQKSEYASREASPQYHGAGRDGDFDLNAYGSAARIPLPMSMSPSQGRSLRNSPDRDTGAGADDHGGGDTTLLNVPVSAQPEVPSMLPVDEGNCESVNLQQCSCTSV